MWILVVIGIFFAIVIIRAYLNSNYKSYKDAEKTIEYSKSEILVEEIEEKDGMFWVKFTYKIAGRKFPIEKLDVAHTKEEANRILEKYRLEFNTAPKEMIVKKEEKDNNGISKGMLWGIIFFGLQFASLAGQYAEMHLQQGDALLESTIRGSAKALGGCAFMIVGAILCYKAYKDK